VVVSITALIGSFLLRTQTLMRLFYLGILMIVMGGIWTYFSISGVKLRRTVRGIKQQLGQVLEERYELINQSRIVKIWIQVDDKSDLPQSNGSRVMSQLRGRDTRSFSSYTLLTRRGLFHLGPSYISSGDPMGLFGRRIEVPASQTLLVLPYMVQLRHFPFPPGYLSGGKVLWRTTQEVTPHAAGVREYAPGDSLSRIHWPITARKDKFMVKEFDQDPQADVWIFLDAEKSVQAKINLPPQPRRVDRLWILGHKIQVKLPPDTFEYSVSAAASIANYFIKRGESVGLACAGQITTTLPAEKGERQLGKILETLAFMVSDGQLPLHGLVDNQIQHITRGSTVIIISTTQSNSLVVSVEKLIRKNIRPIMVLMDCETFGSEINKTELLQQFNEYFLTVILIRKDDDLKQYLENIQT